MLNNDFFCSTFYGLNFLLIFCEVREGFPVKHISMLIWMNNWRLMKQGTQKMDTFCFAFLGAIVKFIVFLTHKIYAIFLKNTQHKIVGPRNKEQVGRHRIVHYCESFPYCKFSSFIKFNFGEHQHSLIECFYSGIPYCEFLLLIIFFSIQY